MLTRPVRNANRELQNETFLPTVRFEPGTYEANALSVDLLQLISIDHLKVATFSLSFLCKLPVSRFHLALPVIFLDIFLCIFLI